MFAIALLIPTACGTSAPPVDAGSTDAPVAVDAAVTPPALPYYEVPVGDAALAPHAFFAVPDVHYYATGGIVTLTYDFPPDLSGIVDQTLTLTGPIDASGGSTLSGVEGTGTCTVSSGVVRCREVFTALTMDAAHARALASGYSTDVAMQAARIAVIDRFVADPIGIVVFDRALANEPP